MRLLFLDCQPIASVMKAFLPRKSGERQQHLRSLKAERRTIVFYRAPHRIAEAMEDILAVLGSNRPMALCRELTKDFEEIRRGTVQSIHDGVLADPPRGEIVLVIGGASDEEVQSESTDLSIDALAKLSLECAESEGLRIKEAITKVVKEHPFADGSFANRKQVYASCLEHKPDQK